MGGKQYLGPGLDNMDLGWIGYYELNGSLFEWIG